ncbi:MAG: hypothetical protein HY669_04275 [Chloroflexi bacterium]|nr:hypothetical protein [Chloroflexota bacterium]
MDTKNRAISRQRFLGYLAGAMGVVLALPLAEGLLRRRSASGNGQWYEVVQDMKDAHSWHINLYSGPALGDLSRGQLLEHRLAQNTSISQVRKQLDYPARIQHLDGRYEQAF